MIYLDYQATTPLAPEAKAAMLPWLDKFANPHSASRLGREAAAAIEVARDQLASCLPPDGETIFTSGATEALNWALKSAVGSGRNKVVTISTEHAAVLDSCDWLENQGTEVIRLPVRTDGIVSLEAVSSAVDERTAVVAAMFVNNEIGVIQPVEAIAEIAHSAGSLMLCDAVQGFGRMPLPPGPDMFAISAHKIHGPKGVGALWLRSGLRPEALLHGGGQERGLRSGTLSPLLIAGFGAAAALASERRHSDQEHAERLWVAALAALGPSWEINGSIEHRYHGNLNIRRDGLDAARLISDLRDIAFSLGSACASGSGRPSHVLRAIGLTDREARSSVRLGLGRYTTEDDLVKACRKISAAADAQRDLAA